MGENDSELARLRQELDALRAENQQLSRQLTEQSRTPEDTEFLRTLLRALPTFVARLDPDLRMRFLNKLAPGFEVEDVLGTPFLEFIDQAHHETALAAIERVRESGGVERYQAEAQGPHRQTSYYETIVAPINEKDGRVGFVLVSVDITEQTERARELARKEEQLRLAVDATGIGLWSYDLERGKVEWSERMREIMGRSEPLPPERYAEEAAHPEDRELVLRSSRNVQEGDASAWAKHRIVRPDGRVRWLIPTGKIFLFTGQDVGDSAGNDLYGVLQKPLRAKELLRVVSRVREED